MIAIDGYADFELIGRGGMATVHRARQVSVGRDVAIKILSDPAPDADLVRRFERESKAVGALGWHPHIGAVVDAGSTESGQAYIAFELLPGGSLDDRLEAGPMPWPEAVTAMVQTADAVEAAHRDDVLHRDIKPANVMLDRLGNAKLVDFGIASMQDGNRTETGMLATTVAHAAPELFDGRPASVATDVYALGSSLFTLLAGHPPFAPEPNAAITAVIRRTVDDAPPALPPTVPAQVAAVVHHALAKQPQHRPRTAAAFGRALQQAQQSLGITPTAMPLGDDDPAQPASPTAVPTPPAAPGPPPPGPATPGAVAPAGGRSPAATSAQRPERPRDRAFTRTIRVLAAVAFLLAALLVGILGFDALRSMNEPIAVTPTGIEVLTISSTEANFVGGAAPENLLDGSPDTVWAARDNPNADVVVVGTTISLTFSEQVQLTRVGIDHGSADPSARVAGLQWATSFDGLTDLTSSVAQAVPVDDGEHTIDVDIVTDELWVLVTATHPLDCAEGDDTCVPAERVEIAELVLD